MIIKIRNKPGFAQIQNETLRDKRLSLEARGALGEILTYSEHFDIDVTGLMALWEIGREKLLKITNQLKECGYLEITDVRDKKGKIIDKEWNFYGESQGVNFREKPANQQAADEISAPAQDAENPHSGECVQDAALPYVGQNQSLENPHHLLKEELREKEEDKDLETKKSGGGGLNGCGTAASERDLAKRAAAAESPPLIPPSESRSDYLLRKQLEFPHFNVERIYENFRRKCGSQKYPLLKNSQRSFDKWLAEQDVEFTDEKQANPAFDEADYFAKKYGGKTNAA